MSSETLVQLQTDSAAKAGPTRFHLSLNVASLERAIAFFKAFFDREPAKCRPDYALGPLAFAECFKCFGSYTPAFWILAPMVGLLAVASLIISTPHAVAGRWDKRPAKELP